MKYLLLLGAVVLASCANNRPTLVCANVVGCKESIGGQVVDSKVVDEGNGRLLRMTFIQAGATRYFCEERMSVGVPDTVTHLSTCMEDQHMKFPPTQ